MAILSKRQLWILLFIGLMAISSSAVLVRMAHAPAVAIAAYRLTIAAFLLLLSRPRSLLTATAQLTPRIFFLSLVSGAALAIHFIAWIQSLVFTTISTSVVLLSTAPFFVALLGWLFLRERVRLQFYFAVIVAIIGMAVVTYDDSTQPDGSALGNALALLGAAGLAGYLVSGKLVQKHISSMNYAVLSYSSAAGFVLICSYFSDTQLRGFTSETYVFLVLIALVPQLLGHTSFNVALHYFTAPFVAAIMLGEPVLATILGAIFLNEIPAISQIVGCTIILVGVFMVIRAEHQPGA